jgi:hypothetical protein
VRSGSTASKLNRVAVSAFAMALALGSASLVHASAERPKEPAKVEVVKPAPVVAKPTPAKPAPKKYAVKKAVKKKPVAKKAKPKPVKSMAASKPLRGGPEVKYDIEHMPVPSSIAAPVQVGGTAEALANPSPALSAPSVIAPSESSGLPPEIMATARPGQCFAQLMTPPETESVTEDVMVRDAHKVKKITPARYEWVEESYLVSGGHKVTRHIPATYRTVRETVVESPATVREIDVPARYESRTERVMRAPERQVWVLSETVDNAYRPGGKLNWPGKVRTDGDGRVWCLMTLPAEFEDVTRTVEVAPATVKRIETAPVTRVIERRIIDVPAHDQVVESHPVYGVRKVQKLIEPAREEWIDVPAAYERRKVLRQVGPAKSVWGEVLCLKTTSKAKVARIQSALKAKGYFKGRVDGLMGDRTLKAMNDFQTAKGLPSGHISIAGLRALGVL